MTLSDLIEMHRAAYRDDLHISRLVQRHPPTTLDLNTGALHQEPAAAIGMNMSARLLKYVSHPEGFGADFPWSKALWRLKAQCRRDHPYHRAADRPYWRGSLCWQFVLFVVVKEFSVENAARILRYDNPEPVLRYALTYVEQYIDRERAKQEKRSKEDEGLSLQCRCGHGWSRHDAPGSGFRCIEHDGCVRFQAIDGPRYSVEQRHDQPGMHAVDCPKCRRNAA